MLGVLGDSVMLGIGVTVILLLFMPVVYTVVVRLKRRYEDHMREASDALEDELRYRSRFEKK